MEITFTIVQRNGLAFRSRVSGVASVTDEPYPPGGFLRVCRDHQGRAMAGPMVSELQEWRVNGDCQSVGPFDYFDYSETEHDRKAPEVGQAVSFQVRSGGGCQSKPGSLGEGMYVGKSAGGFAVKVFASTNAGLVGQDIVVQELWRSQSVRAS